MERIIHYKISTTDTVINFFKDYNEVSPDPFIKRDGRKYGRWVPNGETITNPTEEEIKKYFASPFNSFYTDLYSVSIEEVGDKISIRCYNQFKRRSVGSKFFKVRRVTKYLTYNTKTKNFYCGEINKKNKASLRKTCRVNSFAYNDIENFIYSIRGCVSDINRVPTKEVFPITKFVDKHFKETISVFEKFFELAEQKTGVTVKPISNLNEVSMRLKEIYLKDNCVKTPDTIDSFCKVYIPKKILLKHKNYIDSFMEYYKLNGKRIKKILNQNHKVMYQRMVFLFNILGVDYFNRINESVYTAGNDDSRNESNGIPLLLPTASITLTKTDKEKMILGLNDFVDYQLITEHFSLKYQLMNSYNHIVKPKFKDRRSFNVEHNEWSQLLQSYKKGKITRHYGKDAIENIEESISSWSAEYYPVVLLTSDDYNNESAVQSNCVRGYSEKSFNIIISLRMGSKSSKERATVEYQFGKYDIIREQTYGKFNNTLSPMWDTPLEILDKRMSSLYKEKVLSLPKMKKEFPNGHVIKYNSQFTNSDNVVSMIPVWDKSEKLNDVDFFDFI